MQIIKGNLEIWQWLMLLTVLLPMAVKDIKYRKINGYICLVMIMVSFLIRVKIKHDADFTILLDLIPGVLMYVLSKLSPRSIGEGDALVLIFIGSVVGYMKEMQFLIISVFLAGLIALILFALKKVDRDTKLPFVPFLSVGVLAGGFL
ncbi:MAG: prepilin peptidase [Lachnospiraceae bacterium]|nr:prepilin peptidase [Lachnospiraceae bacterium]